MPLYEVHHSFPFNEDQQQSLASAITKLHCTAFTTPSFFVHVRFVPHDATSGTYFMAGKRRRTNSNHIIGIVRSSASRPKAAYDKVAKDIEEAWYDTLQDSAHDHNSDSNAGAGDYGVLLEEDAESKRLLMVTFTHMLAIREGGMTIPEAGREGEWFNEQIPYMKDMSEKKGLEDFTDMLAELEQRDDLKALLEKGRK